MKGAEKMSDKSNMEVEKEELKTALRMRRKVCRNGTEN